MRATLSFTTIFVVLIGAINFGHAFDNSTLESEESDIDFDFNEIDFESSLIANDIVEDSKLDTVRMKRTHVSFE